MSRTVEPLPIPDSALVAELMREIDRMIEDALYGDRRSPAPGTLTLKDVLNWRAQQSRPALGRYGVLISDVTS
jgi:hypothetical protein